VQQGHGRPSSRQALALKGVVIVRRFATVDSKAGSASGTRPAAFCCSRWGLRLGSAIRAFAGASFISTTVAAGSHAPCIVGIPRTNRGPGTDGIPTTSMTTSCWREPLFAMGREAGTPGRSGGPPSAPAPRPAGATPHGGEADYHAAGIPSTNVASVRGDGPTARPCCVRARDARGVAPLGIASTSTVDELRGPASAESRGRFAGTKIENPRSRLLYVGSSLDFRMQRRGAIPTNGWKLALSVAVRRQARDGPQPAPRASPWGSPSCGLATARRPALRVPRLSPRARRGRPRRG
jgi:hypothetical protein